MVIENREYNLTADAVRQVASLSERLMPEEVTSVDILLEEEGLNGPTVNYTLRRLARRDRSERLAATLRLNSLTILAPRDSA